MPQFGGSGTFEISSVCVGGVEDVAEGGGEGAVELGFRIIFAAGRYVYVRVDEGVHCLDV